MADHDRDAGSRGEEESPRDPAHVEGSHAGGSHVEGAHVEGERQERLRYGETPDGTGFTATAHTMPAQAPGWGRDSSFRDFIRQKPAQIIGAGLIGHVVGTLFGGTAVAVVTSLADRDEPRGMYWDHPGYAPYHGNMRPERAYPGCPPGQDGVRCFTPPMPPLPTVSVMPMPTRTS
ncbi:hypothetical protein ITP53_21635 [Nonomuraea sp. K274]|uniref:Uncharacterized protein n=1 Tax=Nonomuraea cypriaca TaxID=1187855 RepID=A0A931EZF2_9ACTN|nr:hypothetical protein [Nonomuraea cypriaca]MBF8188285.1 hypothetical protein [Nonomuraea cypriaca]